MLEHYKTIYEGGEGELENHPELQEGPCWMCFWEPGSIMRPSW